MTEKRTDTKSRFEKRSQGPRVRYPWAKWFKKLPKKLRRGADFHCQVHGMAQQVRNYASLTGVFVHLAIDGDTITISQS